MVLATVASANPVALQAAMLFAQAFLATIAWCTVQPSWTANDMRALRLCLAGTAAALLIAVSYISFQSLRKDDYDRKVDEIAERVGYPSRDFHEIMRVKKEGYRPNDADWDELLAILNRNTGTEMLQMALGNLKKFRGTRHEAEAVQIAKTHISHNDPFVRGTALAVYWRLEAKDWPIVMKQAAVSDEDKFVRDFAAALIHEGDPSKSKGLSTPMPDPMKNGG